MKTKPPIDLGIRPKMRITLLDKKLVPIQDRLVDAQTELIAGPKDKHKDPIRLEIVLRDQDDITKFKTYLDQLTGDLPLAEKKIYKSSTKVVSLLAEEPLKELIHEMEAKCKTMDELITYLRERGFKFVTKQFLDDKQMGTEVKENHNEYQFMIRCLKEAKDPKNDKFDPQLVIAMKFVGEKVAGAKIYLYNKFLKTIKVDWAKKSDINFKKIVLTRFPIYMTSEERERYRMEERKYQLTPEAEKSKFWLRWNGPVLDANK